MFSSHLSLGAWPLTHHSSAELNIGILVACIPPLQPLLKRAGDAATRGAKTEPETWESRQAKPKTSSSRSYEMLSRDQHSSNLDRTAFAAHGSIMGRSEHDTASSSISKTTRMEVNYGA